MPTIARPRKTPPASASSNALSTPRPVATSTHRAPYGFVFLFILLVGVFAFSTFYVIAQSAQEESLRRESATAIGELRTRVNGLQTQVNTLSAQVSLQQAVIERLTSTSTIGSTPPSRPAQR